jgi:hypothetical protein
MTFSRLIFLTFFIKLLSIEQHPLDEQIKNSWHFFDYLENDLEKALINRANEVLNNSRYRDHHLVKNFYSFMFAQSLLSMTSNEAATVICSIKSEQVVSNVITIITEIAEHKKKNYYDTLSKIFDNNKFFLNESNKFRLETILNLNCFSAEVIKKSKNINIFQKRLFLKYKNNLLLKLRIK